MEKDKVVGSVTKFIVDGVLDGDDSDLDATTPLLELRILDSFSIVSLCSFLETEFGVTLPLETLPVDRLQDIDSIADLVLESNAKA